MSQFTRNAAMRHPELGCRLASLGSIDGRFNASVADRNIPHGLPANVFSRFESLERAAEAHFHADQLAKDSERRYGVMSNRRVR